MIVTLKLEPPFYGRAALRRFLADQYDGNTRTLSVSDATDYSTWTALNAALRESLEDAGFGTDPAK